MSPTLISLLLWIPFLIVAVISGIIYCRAGYKKGLWRALISLGAVVISTVISLLVANLLSSLIGPAIAGLIPSFDSEGMVPAEFIMTIVVGVAKGLIALLLFSIFLLVFNIVANKLTNKFLKDKLIVEEKKFRYAGLGVGVLSTFVFSLLIALPLYGSLAAYVPMVESVMSSSFVSGRTNARAVGGQQSTMVEYVSTVAKHPLVVVSKGGPVSLVYDDLASFNVNGESLNVAGVADIIEEVMHRCESIIDESKLREEVEPEIISLINFLDEKVVRTDWAYAVANELFNEIDKLLERESIDSQYREMVADLFKMNKTEFRENCTTVLELGGYMMKHDSKILTGDADYKTLYDANVYYEVAKAVNITPQSRSFKTMLYYSFAANMFGNAYEDDSDTVKEAVKKFMECYTNEQITDEAMLMAEGEALYSMMFEGGNMAESFVRHPYFGIEALENTKEYLNFKVLSGYSYADGADNLVNSGNIDVFLDALERSASKKLGESNFELGMGAVYDFAMECSNGGGLTYMNLFGGVDTFKLVRAVFNDEFVRGTEVDGESWETFKKLSDSYITAFENGTIAVDPDDPYTDYGFGAILRFVDRIGTEDEFWPYEEFFKEDYVANGLRSCVGEIVRNDSAIEFMQHAVANKGNDPFGFGKRLSSQQKKWFKNYVEAFLASPNDSWFVNENIYYFNHDDFNQDYIYYNDGDIYKIGKYEDNNGYYEMSVPNPSNSLCSVVLSRVASMMIMGSTEVNQGSFGSSSADTVPNGGMEMPEDLADRLNTIKAFFGI